MSNERAQRCHAGLNLKRADGGGKESVYTRKLHGMVVHNYRKGPGGGRGKGGGGWWDWETGYAVRRGRVSQVKYSGAALKGSWRRCPEDVQRSNARGGKNSVLPLVRRYVRGGGWNQERTALGKVGKGE